MCKNGSKQVLAGFWARPIFFSVLHQGVIMKKIALISVVAAAAMFAACSDDSSSSGASSKACVYKHEGKVTNCTADAEMIETMCEGDNAELVESCPEGYTAECPTGDKMFGTEYYYGEGAECPSFLAQ